MTTESLPELPPIVDPRHPEGRPVTVPPAIEETPTPPAEEQPKEDDKPSEEAKEPEYTLPELAKMEGQKANPAPDAGEYFWKHNLAAFEHGWNTHEYHQNTKIKMTRTDYKAALEAAVSGSTHAPAMRK